MADPVNWWRELSAGEQAGVIAAVLGVLAAAIGAGFFSGLIDTNRNGPTADGRAPTATVPAPSNTAATSTVQPAQTPSPTPRPLEFMDRIAGDWTEVSWSEGGGPVTLGIVVESGSLVISGSGAADWQLEIDEAGEDNRPQPGIRCGGEVTLREQIEARPGGDRNGTIDWTGDLRSIDRAATGEGHIFRALCGWTVIGGRYPFDILLGGEPTRLATRMELRNEWGTFIWTR